MKLDFSLNRKFYFSINDLLRTIGKNLLKLKYLFFRSNFYLHLNENYSFDENEDLITGDLFPVLAQFKNIEYLKICHKGKYYRFSLKAESRTKI